MLRPRLGAADPGHRRRGRLARRPRPDRDGRQRLAAFLATPDEPAAVGIVVLPDVRGLYRFYEELALRFAERGYVALAFDYFGRTAGVEKRDDDFVYMPHVEQTTEAGSRPTSRAAVARLREPGARRSSPSASASAAATRGSRRRAVTALTARSASTARRPVRADGAGPRAARRRDRVPDPGAAGRRRPEHHRRDNAGSTQALARAGSTIRSSRSTARRTASSTASRRTSPWRQRRLARRSDSSPHKRDPRDRPGHDRHDLPRRRRRPARARPRLPRAAAALPAAGLGRARSGGDLASVLARRPRGRGGIARRSTRSGSRTSARRRVLWDRATGRPVAPAIVWQDRRTAERCRELDAGPDPRAHRARARPVLLGDQARVAARASTAAHGARVRHGRQLARLEAHRRRAHVTDVTNASRTLLAIAADARVGRRAARALRRRPRAAAADRRLGRARWARASSSARASPIGGIAGDQQAALFGQACCGRRGQVHVRDGRFVLVNTGDDASPPPHGLLERRPRRDGYALEGAVLVAGAAVQWLRDGLGVLADAAEIEALARGSPRPAACSSCPRSPGSARRGGTRRARPRSPASRAARRAPTSRARRSRRSRSRSPTCVDALPAAAGGLRADGGAAANELPDAVPGRPAGSRSRSRPSARRPRSGRPRSPPAAGAGRSAAVTSRAGTRTR